MIAFEIDAEQSILVIRPSGALEEGDFTSLTRAVDAYLGDSGELAGVIVEAASFPGWDSLGALVAHVKFVREHHKRIRKVAVVTDSEIGNLAERLASHFLAAKVRRFPAGDFAAARAWITSA